MNIIKLVPVISSMIFMGSCVSVAKIEKDESVDFAKYKTFTWIDEDRDSADKYLNDIQETNLEHAVTNELINAKWEESKTRPDVLLRHDVVVEKTVKESRDAVYSRPYTRPIYNPYARRWVSIYYPSRFLGYESNEYHAKEGTITITMIDAKTDKVIWQGWTTEEIDRNLTSKDIRSGVKSIFKKFDLEKE